MIRQYIIYKNSSRIKYFNFAQKRKSLNYYSFLLRSSTKRYYSSVSIYGYSPVSNTQNIVSYLSSIFGLNRPKALRVCAKFYLNPKITVGEISNEKLSHIKHFVENFSKQFLATDLKRILAKRLVFNLKQGSFKSKRFLCGLPVNGQSARANGKTARRLLKLAIPKGFARLGPVVESKIKKNKSKKGKK